MDEIRVDAEITLRPPGLPDAERLFALIDNNREHLGRWLPGLASVTSVAQERAWLQGRIDDPGGEKPMLILLGDELVGVIGAHVQEQNDAAEIGYWIAEGRQGHGITTRSCAAMVDELLRGQGMNRVVIRAAVDNARSRAVPVRLGFVHEGIERQAVKLPTGYADMAVYSILASEWRGAEEMGYVDRSGQPLTFGAPPILIDSRMMIRRPRGEDASGLYRLLRANVDRMGWWSAWGPRVKSGEDAAQIIRTALQSKGRRGSPLFVFESNILVGAVNVDVAPGNHGSPTADLRYWIGAEWEGRGLMERACRAAVDAAIAHFGLAEVTIHAGAGNMRARSLAERLGFRMRQIDRGATATEDVIVYAVSAEDWAAAGAQR